MFETIRQRLNDKPIYPWLIFCSIMVTAFISNFNTSSLTIALKTFENEFNTTTSTVQWVLSAFLLIVVGILPIAGKISDLIGRKIIFLFGLLIFLIGSILAPFSLSITSLIITRGIQGFGSGILQGNTMSIIANTFKKGRRGKALGLIGFIVAFGTVVGPIIGGFLIKNYGWQSLFWFNIPFLIFGLIGSIILLPMDHKKSIVQLDYVGSVLFFIFMVTLLLYISNGDSWGFNSQKELILISISVVFFIIFIFWELKNDNPLIELSFFKIPTFSIGNSAVFISYLLMMFPAILLPYYLASVFSYPVDKIGLVMSAQAIAMGILAPISGAIADKIGALIPSFIGMLLTLLSLILLSQISIDTTVLYIILSTTLFGIGAGLFQSPNNVSIIESIPIHKSGSTGSIIATIRNFGRISGVALAIVLYSVFYTNKENIINEIYAIKQAFVISIFIALLGVILVSILFFVKKGENY